MTGTFGPDLLAQLNAIGRQEQALAAQKSALLAAYSDGKGLGPGSYAWDTETGAWTHTPKDVSLPSPPAGAPGGAEGPSQHDPEPAGPSG